MKSIYENRLWYQNNLIKPMGGRKHSLNFVGLGQGQRPPVFFYTMYNFENHIHIYLVLYYENPKKNSI